MTEPELTDEQAGAIIRRIAEGLPGWSTIDQEDDATR